MDKVKTYTTTLAYNKVLEYSDASYFIDSQSDVEGWSELESAAAPVEYQQPGKGNYTKAELIDSALSKGLPAKSRISFKIKNSQLWNI